MKESSFTFILLLALCLFPIIALANPVQMVVERPQARVVRPDGKVFGAHVGRQIAYFEEIGQKTKLAVSLPKDQVKVASSKVLQVKSLGRREPIAEEKLESMKIKPGHVEEIIAKFNAENVLGRKQLRNRDKAIADISEKKTLHMEPPVEQVPVLLTSPIESKPSNVGSNPSSASQTDAVEHSVSTGSSKPSTIPSDAAKPADPSPSPSESQAPNHAAVESSGKSFLVRNGHVLSVGALMAALAIGGATESAIEAK